ncbi:N-formylglutamate amidohydrolase [Sulfitobacter sp. JB4-11]|uniref:N-formylglutamate amidohydrolase n=1 Tax=Sulfitobacter rhodophyticola TaxID=3238304 RepID=UPI00351759BA
MIEVTQGSLPVVLGIPHSGSELPSDVLPSLSETGQALAETDWHVDRLYNGLGMDLSVVRTPIHRYVIDVDHPPTAFSSFAGLMASGLFPLTDRKGAPIYRDGAAPDATEMAARVEKYHAPYHAAVSAELARVKAYHGAALLFDCHSIGSFNPQDAPVSCPDINLWTNLSRACANAVESCILTRCYAADRYRTRLSQGTSGGWSVAQHGQPGNDVHAVRLELAQSCYMDETPPWAWRADKAERLRSTLYRVLNDLVELLYERAQR